MLRLFAFFSMSLTVKEDAMDISPHEALSELRTYFPRSEIVMSSDRSMSDVKCQTDFHSCEALPAT